LCAVRDAVAILGIKLKIRCLFVENDPKSFRKLEEHLGKVDDIQIKLINGEFEENIN
jgi:hypothetical protein